MIVTIQEAKDYIGLDFEDDQVLRNLNRAIAATDKMLAGSLGENYPSDDARVKEMALMIVDDLYNHRGMISPKVSHNVRLLFNNFEQQIKFEMRRKKDGI